MTEKQIFKKWFSNEEYYNSNNIRTMIDDNGHSVDIAFIYSGRNRGKSFDISARAIMTAYYSDGKQTFGYVRRLDKEMKMSSIEQYFDDKIPFIKDVTSNKCDCVLAKSDGIYLGLKEVINNKVIKNPVLKIGYFFALNNYEQYKSLQYPTITTLIFEEVFTNGRYINNEINALMSLISTVQRNKTDFIAFLISNTVRRINPYSKGLGLNGLKNQKPGTIDNYKLFKGVFDENGNEEYYYIAVEYLKDRDNELKKSFLEPKRNRLTTISSNKWEEINQYTVATNKIMCPFFSENKVVFQLNNDMFICTVSDVPYNIEDMLSDSDIKEDNNTFTILYIERKTTPIHPGTRVYTNIPTVNPYYSKRFKRIYPIDDIVYQCINNGYCIYSDNLTANEFNQILKELF